MKAKKTKWKRISAAILVTLISTMVIFYSCEKENIQPTRQDTFDTNEVLKVAKEEKFINNCGLISQRDLLDENNRKLATVTLYNDAKFLHVNILAENKYKLANAYLYTGTKEELPMNFQGDLRYKLFNNIIISENLVRSHDFKIPLVGLNKSFIMALMVQTSDSPLSNDPDEYVNGWADGKPFGELRYGRAFYFKKSICLDTADPVDLEQ